MIAAFVAANVRGVTTSGLTEDVVVYTKLAVLSGIALIGLAAFSSTRLAPLDNEGLAGVFLGAAVIFVAYEGFELVPYDYDDLVEPRRTLPRALYLSVAVVVADLRRRHARRPDAGARPGDHRSEGGCVRDGRPGGTRSLRPMGGDDRRPLLHQLRDQRDAVLDRPPGAGRERKPESSLDRSPRSATASRLVRSCGSPSWGPRSPCCPAIIEIISFGSLTFLGVFGLINLLHARHTATPGWDRGLAYAGGIACFAAAAGLLYYLARWDRPGLWLIGACAVAVGLARVGFVRLHRRAS